jgi:hypothetical protein
MTRPHYADRGSFRGLGFFGVETSDCRILLALIPQLEYASRRNIVMDILLLKCSSQIILFQASYVETLCQPVRIGAHSA